VKKSQRTKLSLSRETVRALDEQALAQSHGAAVYSGYSICYGTCASACYSCMSQCLCETPTQYPCASNNR
jgi:hypothetical protein